jgi:LacI family transcriptional regulator, repressor for deo operon, udp, cdd, tsx, nupC, and nupG
VASIDDVAAKAGVSTATVSRALSGRVTVSPDTKQRVLDAASELGYVVSSSASGLASGRTRNIGIVVPFLTRWYYTQVIEGAQRELLKSGYDVTLYNLAAGDQERDQVFGELLHRQRVDAVIAVSLELTPDQVRALHSVGKPVVGVGGPIPDVPTLSVNDAKAAHTATSYLISLGHTRIGTINGDSHGDIDFHLSSTRLSGFKAALADAGCEFVERWYSRADFSMEDGYRAAERLLRLTNRPTALFCASDEMAFGAILACKDAGLNVPNDMSIIGIDGHDHSSFFGLTTLAQYPRKQGAKAAAMLVDELSDPSPGGAVGNTEMPLDLVVRSSTATLSV